MLIDEHFLNMVSAQAKASPRLRTNYNVHQSLEDKCHRMLNALEVKTKVHIHRHLETSETTICLQGCLDVVFYDLRPNEDAGGPLIRDSGTVIAEGMEANLFERTRVRLCPREGKYGVQIPIGVWHSVEVYEPSTIFEAKDGRYKG